MGHYDSCYEYDRELKDKEKDKELKENIDKFLKKSSLEDKKFINNIINNIKEYKILFKFLNQKK